MRTLRQGMSGTDIMEIQAALNKLGYGIEVVDGVFGPETDDAVKAFQRERGLEADGIIGPRTYDALEKYLLGYTTVTLKKGDSFYNIAKRMNSTVELITTANSGLQPARLQVGIRVVVPFHYPVVDTNIDYTYAVLERDIRGLRARYPFIEAGVAGQSVMNRKLYYLRLGRGENKLFYNASHHSLEWITTPVLMKFIEDFSEAYARGRKLGGFDPKEVWEKSSIYLIPMVNPDGVELVLNGLRRSNPYYDDLIDWNHGSTDFSTTWDANNHGVDLNHNYDAEWEKSKLAAERLGINGPAPRRFPGPYPESEPESRALVEYTRKYDFKLTLSYHSQGEVIFWNFNDLADAEARRIGEVLAQESGYTLTEAQGIASTGGYKDWFIQEYKRPAYTVEVGKGRNPLPISQFDKIYEDNLPLLMHAALL